MQQIFIWNPVFNCFTSSTLRIFWRLWEKLFTNSRQTDWDRCLANHLHCFSKKEFTLLNQGTPHCWGHLLLCCNNIYLRFIPPTNLWKKCIDLSIFSKCFVPPVLRLSRSNVVCGWILRFWSQKFLGKSEKSATNLCITNISKVLFIGLFHSSLKRLLRTYRWHRRLPYHSGRWTEIK